MSNQIDVTEAVKAAKAVLALLYPEAYGVRLEGIQVPPETVTGPWGVVLSFKDRAEPQPVPPLEALAAAAMMLDSRPRHYRLIFIDSRTGAFDGMEPQPAPTSR